MDPLSYENLLVECSKSLGELFKRAAGMLALCFHRIFPSRSLPKFGSGREGKIFNIMSP